MLLIDGFCIAQEEKMNRIVITLPPTIETATNTLTTVVDRKRSLSDAELGAILYLVKELIERR